MTADPIHESTLHMHAGIHAMEAGQWETALEHFEPAVRLRHSLPWQTDPTAAWLLAAAWLNHGEAMWKSNQPTFVKAALRSMDGCIAAMERVPLDENPAFPERLILAWINRATWHGELSNPSAAVLDFSQAETLLDRWGRSVSATRRVLNCMLGVNRARVLLQAGQPRAAWQSIRNVADTLRQADSPAASIKGWSLQCRILAVLLDEGLDQGEQEEWIALATDSAEEALALVRETGYLDAWVPDLVRYGARIYRVCQPQFLGEFLSDWLGNGPLAADAPLRLEMQRELLLAQVELERRVLAASENSDFVQRQIAVLKSFQLAAQRLNLAVP
jgi:hypothetical protein